MLRQLARALWRRATLAGGTGQEAAESPGAPPNEAVLQAYGDRARAAGFDRLYLYLTFDCDTDGDANAARELDPWLQSLGIRPGYAVPGAQLERGAEIYRGLSADGAEFLNHGALPHAEWRDDRYHGITFYDQMAMEEVAGDIRKGHDIVTAVIGAEPKGFRAPHFGCFQNAAQLDLIYRVARELGYQYCSTTLPQLALDHGPVVARDDLYEIPVFGSYAAPTTILDSWTYLEDRRDYRLGEIYWELFRETVDFMLSNDVPGVLSYYADPAHVIDQRPFIDAMELVKSRSVPSVEAADLIAMTRNAAHPVAGRSD